MEKIFGKEKNTGYKHFVLFSQCCQKSPFCGKELRPHIFLGITITVFSSDMLIIRSSNKIPLPIIKINTQAPFTD